jgi:hypothetical protein
MIAVFSCGNEFNIMAEPDFFVPALQWPFILRVNAAQKRAAWMSWGNCAVERKRSGAILAFLNSSGQGPSLALCVTAFFKKRKRLQNTARSV